MTPLSHDQYRTLRADAQVIEADGHGEKVLRLADGTFLKLFRRKRLVSSALLYPYAKRFADNIEALKSRGIACPSVIGVYRVAAIQRDLVHYMPLLGKTLRQFDDPVERSALRAHFGAFVAELHNKGIYFRSLHLGNVILGKDGTLGLIDIADLTVGRRSLSKRKRLRNFRHVFRYPADQEWLTGSGDTAFFNSYALQAKPAIELSELTQIVLG
ncbi:hypothetical protein MT1_0900 [Pseudomonas sp. MT-1]|uniref:toluene tolerance protein n=1 Tax=Stutzerimonas stutzeri TaxID=316 RepID=UPI0005360EEE|nr:toluene tolerance protein [Stutzerimonas stutzeri]MCQ4281675.1 toluene tolerance protein [Stutzerimonas stutzeri]BAP78077.1 hypothetical protein MT1_0900 [Pseudomonas sp. MT-1]